MWLSRVNKPQGPRFDVHVLLYCASLSGQDAALERVAFLFASADRPLAQVSLVDAHIHPPPMPTQATPSNSSGDRREAPGTDGWVMAPGNPPLALDALLADESVAGVLETCLVEYLCGGPSTGAVRPSTRRLVDLGRRDRVSSLVVRLHYRGRPSADSEAPKAALFEARFVRLALETRPVAVATSTPGGAGRFNDRLAAEMVRHGGGEPSLRGTTPAHARRALRRMMAALGPRPLLWLPSDGTAREHPHTALFFTADLGPSPETALLAELLRDVPLRFGWERCRVALREHGGSLAAPGVSVVDAARSWGALLAASGVGARHGPRLALEPCNTTGLAAAAGALVGCPSLAEPWQLTLPVAALCLPGDQAGLLGMLLEAQSQQRLGRLCVRLDCRDRDASETAALCEGLAAALAKLGPPQASGLGLELEMELHLWDQAPAAPPALLAEQLKLRPHALRVRCDLSTVATTLDFDALLRRARALGPPSPLRPSCVPGSSPAPAPCAWRPCARPSPARPTRLHHRPKASCWWTGAVGGRCGAPADHGARRAGWCAVAPNPTRPRDTRPCGLCVGPDTWTRPPLPRTPLPSGASPCVVPPPGPRARGPVLARQESRALRSPWWRGTPCRPARQPPPTPVAHEPLPPPSALPQPLQADQDNAKGDTQRCQPELDGLESE